MGNFETFLINTKNKIKGLEIDTDTHDFTNYEILNIKLDGNLYKIKREFVVNFDNYYRKYSQEELEKTKVDPYEKLGSIKEDKRTYIDNTILDSEEKVIELIDKIVDKIYEKYNFLVLPPTEDELIEINPKNYIDGEFQKGDLTQDKTSKQRLYSIGFKIKAENGSTTDYFPFKIYFRFGFDKNNDVKVDIAEEINNLSTIAITNVLTNKKYTKKDKENLKSMIENGDFNDDKELIDENIDKIIRNIMVIINNYVLNFDESPEWFKKTKFGKYIQEQIYSGTENIDATSYFRYITQTPLPYSYLTVKFSNVFNRTEKYDIKMASKDNQALNDDLNKCPICNSSINSKNKLKASNEYKQGFLGCQSCMSIKCDDCDNTWSKNKEPEEINEKPNGVFLYKAGRCPEPTFCVNKFSCYGKNLCSEHAKKCSCDACLGLIYCEKAVEKCSNPNCNNTFCINHSQTELYSCRTSKCKNNPNKYCKECKNDNLYTCSYCGNTMCDSCKKNVISANNEILNDEFICIDCFNKLTNDDNREINIINKALQLHNTEYYAVSIGDVHKYKGNDGQYIIDDISKQAYYNSKADPLLWYRDKEVNQNQCADCGQYFYKLDSETIVKDNDNSKYCGDCLKTCSICERRVADKHAYMELDKENKEIWYCNNDDCFKNKWYFSDISSKGKVIEDKTIFERAFIDQYEGEKIGLLPVRKENLFTCPATRQNVNKDYQTQKCPECELQYSITYFDNNTSNCKSCDELKNQKSDEIDLRAKLFYLPKYGSKDKFRVFINENMMMIKYELNNEIHYNSYLYEKKSGKYKKYKER